VPAQLNHHIVHARDAKASADQLAEWLDLEAPTFVFGHFWVVEAANGVSLDYMTVDDPDAAIQPQHYAFLVSDEQFDATFVRLKAGGFDHYADPGTQQRNQINTADGGRGVYWYDADGHLMEIITTPYGVPKA
jgi:catechol 2,3-dioxygenase-like lactoylglutathione lyase family enzyme